MGLNILNSSAQLREMHTVLKMDNLICCCSAQSKGCHTFPVRP